MTKEHLKQFLDQPGINAKGICDEAGVDESLIYRIIAGKRALTEATQKKLVPVMKKYGWVEIK